ncbi:c6 zinc finger domain containing protein [Ophiostoma piceae UAMH 11346]|uniref:C6 zinc finger domain containing protein n=1 Tax=Ophiostoma piceae (strain UAMH 11346) TaxID=1262450 RepID=S3C074_OPHP1|nr:c6 zinc finger domain containing protein [Ophiostoma piceae UAMH 11346]
MDHPLPLPSAAAWLSSDFSDRSGRSDRIDRFDRLDPLHSCETLDSLDDALESSESDRPAQWIRAGSTSSSRSTLLSDVSVDVSADLSAAIGDDSSSSPRPADTSVHSPHSDEMQWEVVDQGHAHSHDPSHDHSHHSHEHAYGQAPESRPKIEPGDEYDFCLEDVQPAPPPAATKRPRGRPRKPSISSASATAAAASASKIAKARSKTGCTTCRRRKKKCDETKPICLNCEKNAVVCEGYKEKHVWKSGRERAQDEILKAQPPLDITLQPIFMGMECREDRLFWNYYRDHVSNVFTAEFDHENAFRTILVPLATNHQAMMHSVLSLASRHIKFDSPQVQKLLRRSTKVTPDSLHIRGSFHNSEALTRLSRGMYHSMSISMSINSDDWKAPDALAAQYAQMLFLVLESLAEGQHDGSQRLHYEFFLYMLDRWPPLEPEFYAFISEIFYYHIYADDLIYCPLQQKPRLVVGDWIPAMPVLPPRLIGIADGLFNHLSQITSIRNRIRVRVQSGADPRVDYDSLYRASDIESQIYDWKPDWDAGDSRDRATLLYKQMAWLYLKTTVCPPSSSYIQTQGLCQPHTLESESALHSGSTTCASSPVLHATNGTNIVNITNIAQIEAMIPAANNFSNPRRHSIANPSLASGSRPFLPKFVSFAEHDTTETFEAFDAFDAFDATGSAGPTDAEDCASPPPIRRPVNYESGVSVAVKESLALLESFSADDQCQTLLLVPCVVVGTACYSPADQERIRTAIRAVHSYTGLRNTDLALELLNKVWQLMEHGNFLAAWDWQTVAFHLRIQHLF